MADCNWREIDLLVLTRVDDLSVIHSFALLVLPSLKVSERKISGSSEMVVRLPLIRTWKRKMDISFNSDMAICTESGWITFYHIRHHTSIQIV